MKNLTKLSRNQLKKVVGGQSCTLSIQGPNGNWITRTGTCKTKVTVHQITPELSIPSTSNYCETGLGEVSVTSNGGQSRC